MKSKKLKVMAILLMMSLVAVGLMSGCGKKEEKKEPKTTQKEINGHKVEVTDNGDGTAQFEMPDDDE